MVTLFLIIPRQQLKALFKPKWLYNVKIIDQAKVLGKFISSTFLYRYFDLQMVVTTTRMSEWHL